MTNADPEEIDDQGFVCTLNGEPVGDLITVNRCGSPLTGIFTGSEEFRIYLLVNYTFTVAAFIVINETPIIDPEPASITWTIEEEIVVDTTLDAVDGNGDTHYRWRLNYFKRH